MIAFAFITFSFLGLAFALARRIDGTKYGTLGIILFGLLALLSVEMFGAFNAFTLSNLAVLAGIFLCMAIGLEFKTFSHFTVRKISMRACIEYFGIALFLILIAIFASIIPLAETDSFGYHLPIVSQLLKTHGVWDVFFAGFVGPNTYFPANHEALQAFFAIQTGAYNLNFLVTEGSFLLLFLSLKDLAKNKLSSIYPFIFALSVAITPFLFRQFLDFQIDLFMFCLFGSAIAFLASAYVNKDKLDMAKAMLVLGLCLGSKYNAIPQVLVLIPFIISLAINLKTRLKEYGIYAGLIILPSFFWYLRNTIVAGNPLYPFGIDFGFLHFAGHASFVSDTVNTSMLSHLQSDGLSAVLNQISTNVEFTNELGIAPIVLLLVALLGTIFLMARKRNFALGLTLFLVAILESIYYLNSPYTFTLWNQTIRYASPIFALAPTIFVLCALKSNYTGKALLTFASFILAFQIFSNSFLFNPTYTSVLAQGFTQNQTLTDQFLSIELPDYKELLPVLTALRNQEKDATPTIALAGLTPYALFEKEGFIALYVNIDGCTTCKYPAYKNAQKSIRTYPSQKDWESALNLLNVDYLLVDYVSYEPNIKMLEEEWAKNNPNLFTQILKTTRYSLYAIN
ncbi:MAG: hypothetical protein WC897_02685 [Candidatus Gracilibacteria bacterium]